MCFTFHRTAMARFFFNLFFAALSHSSFGHVRFNFAPYSTFSIVQCRTTVWRIRIHGVSFVTKSCVSPRCTDRKGKFRIKAILFKMNRTLRHILFVFFFVFRASVPCTDICCALRAYRKTFLFKKKKKRTKNLLHFLTNDHFPLNCSPVSFD